jgi:hypothetical protein
VNFDAINCSYKRLNAGSYPVFDGCTSLSTLNIGNQVQSIPDSTFSGCTGLTSVTIPNSVTSIGNSTFSGCTGLTSVTLPNSVITIGKQAFSGCTGLTFITIPNTVTSIGEQGFYNCTGLTSVTIGNSVASIGNSAFYNCSGLRNVTNLSLYPQTIANNVFSGGVNLGICTLTVATSAVSAYQNAATWKNFSLVVGGGILLSAIAKYPAFGRANSTPSHGLYPINTSVTISAAPYAGYAFLEWTSGKDTLGNTSPLSFTLTRDTTITANIGNPNSVVLTAAGTLNSQTSIKTFTHLTVTGNIDARDIQFMRDSMPHLLELDLSAATIVAYSGTEGTHYGYSDTYPANEMPQYSLDTSLISVKIPNSITSVGNNAFYGCSKLITVTIPNSVISIGDYAFFNCSGLIDISIGSSVTSIGEGSFGNCSGMTEMYVKAVNPPLLGNYAFHNIPPAIAVDVPCGSENSYRTAYGWSSFTNIKEKVPFHISVQSNNVLMGTATVIQSNSCTVNTAIIGATVNQGFQFVKWNDDNAQNPRTVTVIQDMTFTAIFSAIQYRVTVSANDASMGTVSGGGDYAPNSSATIVAIANTGYRFVQWNDGNTQNPRTITVTQNIAFMAEFADLSANSYQVSVWANNSSMGTVTGSGNYNANTTATITAIPNTGYHFVQWNDGNTNNPRTVTVTKDTNFTALFAATTPGKYHVWVISNDINKGTVVGEGDYTANSTVTIGATPVQGYRFVQWNDGNTQNPRTFTVTRDTTFTAIFDVIEYKVLLSANNANRGTVSGDGTYAYNSMVTVSATPNTGFRFVFWNDGNTDSMRVITVTRDSAFDALFGIEDMYYVYAAPSNPTMGSVTGSDDYHKRHGDSPIFKSEYAANSIASITAIPNTGYRFVQWDDGNTENPRAFTVTQDAIFKAIFTSTTGVTDIESSAISIYPNPAEDYITVILPENVSNAVFTVYDMQGKALLQQNISNKETVSVSNLAAGIYIYSMRTEKENYQGKIVLR